MDLTDCRSTGSEILNREIPMHKQESRLNGSTTGAKQIKKTVKQCQDQRQD